MATTAAPRRPTLPPLPLVDVGREMLGLTFLLDSGLRGGCIAEFWTTQGATERSFRGDYALSRGEGLLLRIALNLDAGGPTERPGDLHLLLNGVTGRALQALIRLLQALDGGHAAKIEYCSRVLAEFAPLEAR